jgi:hypothetical protein
MLLFSFSFHFFSLMMGVGFLNGKMSSVLHFHGCYGEMNDEWLCCFEDVTNEIYRVAKHLEMC